MRTRLVLLGAGHAHAGVLHRFGRRPMPDVELILLTPSRRTLYSGMLPGVVAGHYRHAEAEIDVERLARFAGAVLHLGQATGLDLSGRRVLCGAEPPVPFDLLSIDVGSAADMPAGLAGHAVPVRPVATFLDRFDEVAGQGGRVAVIGSGVAGSELALALQHRLSTTGAADERPAGTVVLVGRAATPAPEIGAAGKRLEQALRRHGVRVVSGFAAARMEGDRIVAEGDARCVEADVVLWATGSAALPWLGASGLSVDKGGFVAVDETLRSRSHPFVFAVGDAAALPIPRPKAGVFAVRQAPVLAGNLRRALRGRSLRRYRPQRNWLRLISLGERRALATRGGWWLEGRLAWTLKNWIDRRYVARFNRVPD